MPHRVSFPGRLQPLTRRGSGALRKCLVVSTLIVLSGCDPFSADPQPALAQQGSANLIVLKVGTGPIDLGRYSAASISARGSYGYLWGPDGEVSRWTEAGGRILVDTIHAPPDWAGTAAAYSDPAGVLWLADSTGREWDPRSPDASTPESPTRNLVIGALGNGHETALILRDGDSIRVQGIAGTFAVAFELDTASTAVPHSRSRKLVWDSESGTAIEVDSAGIF